MLADLLQPATPDLARRWLAALLMVPQSERQTIVQAVEARIVSQFGTAQEHTAEFNAERAAEPAAHSDNKPDAENTPKRARKQTNNGKQLSKLKQPDATIEVVHPPVQRPGYIEQVITTYEKMDAPRIARRTPCHQPLVPPTIGGGSA